MSEYYLLPPSIKVEGDVYIEGSLTFVNHPNNALSASLSKHSEKPTFLGIYKLLSDKWKLLEIIEVEFNSSSNIKRSCLDVKDNDFIVIVSRNDTDFAKNPKKLQQPDLFRLDKAVTAQRASFNLELGQTITSYQSEYPYFLSRQQTSSFMSFDSVSYIANRPNIQCYIILLNLNIDATYKKDSLLNVADPQTPSDSINFIVSTNSYNLIACREYSSLCKYSNSLLLTCSELTFIPLFLLIDTLRFELSLEHTHPPAELLWGTNKYPIIKQMKSSWLAS